MNVNRITALTVVFLAAVAPARANETPLQIRTAHLQVRYESAAGRFSVTAGKQARPFLNEGKLNGKKGTARDVAVADRTFGKGLAIEVAYPDGNRDEVMLFPGLPF